jgi:hypothetical protein
LPLQDRRPLRRAGQRLLATSWRDFSAHALNALPRSVSRGRSGEWCPEVPLPSSSGCRPNALAAVSKHCPCRAQLGDECFRCRSHDRIVWPRGEDIEATRLAGSLSSDLSPAHGDERLHLKFEFPTAPRLPCRSDNHAAGATRLNPRISGHPRRETTGPRKGQRG